MNQLSSDALDALLASGDYSNAMELNSRLMSATTAAATSDLLNAGTTQGSQLDVAMFGKTA